MKEVIILEKINKFLIIALVFLMPLWFLPVTQDFLDFQKQSIFILSVFSISILSILGVLNIKEISIKLNWINVLVILFVLSSFISSVFSVWPYVSFWGWPLNVSDNFISVLFFAILFFLIINVLKSEKEISWMILSFISAMALAVLFSILQAYEVFSIPFSFFKVSTFNTIGSMNSVAILSAIFMPLSFMMALSSKSILKWILFLISFIFLSAVLLVNFFYALISLSLGLIILILFGFLNLREESSTKWIYSSIVLLAILLVLLVFRLPISVSPKMVPEQSPSGATEISILYGSLKQNAVFGTGPATFSLDYSKYHDPSLNKSVFWGATFSSGASEIIDKFITTGIFGGILMISIFLVSIIFFSKNILKSKINDQRWFLKVGLLSSLVVMFSAQLFYYANFLIYLSFWILLAAISSIISDKEKNISLSKNSKKLFAFISLFLILIILGSGFIFIAGQKYVAEIIYFNGLKEISRQNQDVGISKILSATKLNPSMDLYWRDLAQFSVSIISGIDSDSSLSEDDKKLKSQNAISNAVFAADRSVKIAPANVENWNLRGYVYRSLIGIDNADELAIESYNRSVELQPASPFAWTELGRVYLLKAQYLAKQNKDPSLQKDALDKSLEASNRAIELDPEYAPAYYLVALAYDQQGKSDQAIQKLEESQKKAPKDVSLAFQIGMIYYQKEKISEAIIQFKIATNLDPSYSNARYMLGLSYEKQGNLDKAINEFEKLKELNPNDSEIRTILDNLKQGKPSYGQIN